MAKARTPVKEEVDHPDHYGGEGNPYEVINIIEHFDLGFRIGNAVKYLLRAGKKDSEEYITALRKARWYLDREIQMVYGVDE